MSFDKKLKQEKKYYKQNFGIYKIFQKSTNKFYVGSTTVNFYNRIMAHYFLLESNTHDNNYLQNSWSKYTKEDFDFEILEICTDKSNVLIREQFYIDTLDACNQKIAFNLNPKASETPKLTEEQLIKRGKVLSKINKEKSNQYKKWLNSEILDTDLKEKDLNLFKKWKSYTPWNKGINMNEDLKKKLSNSAKNRKCSDEGKQLRKQKMRNRLPIVYVYDKNYKFLGKWNSSRDLSDESLNKDFKLANHMELRNELGRNGRGPFVLQVYNINKSCTKNIIYKGLHFRHEPLHQEIDVEKMEEFDESPAKQNDNVEPSIVNENKSNNEGVETND